MTPPGNNPQIVEEAKFRPGRCLASGDTQGPFVDCGRWSREHDPYVQLSTRWLEKTATELLGMVPAKEVEERYAFLEAKLKEQADELSRLSRFQEAVVEYEEAREAMTPKEKPDDTAHDSVK